MDGTLYIAHTNWDRLEVRDEFGNLAFAFEPRQAGAEWMPSDPLFARNHLVLAKSSGEFNQGFWAWEWASRREILSESFHSDGYPFLCQPHNTDVVLAQDPEGIAVWDLQSARRRRIIPCEGPNSAAVHTATRRIAYSTYGALHVVSEAGLPASQWSVFGDWDSLAWGLDGSVLIGVPVRRGALVIDPKSGATTHTFPVLGNVLAASPEGRWIAFERGLVDLHSMTVHEHTRHVGGSRGARAACFDSATRQFAFVGRSFVWRVPV
jgi:hypothetical protein